tara:strand:- start:390 stop:1382 length:993 start_codon:yes stop_codon:yes gene_type:complete
MKLYGKYPKTRLRRYRDKNWIRRLVSENDLSVNDLIMPIFICEGKNRVEKINSMPGIKRYSVDKIGPIIDKASKLKIPLVALFPFVSSKKKDAHGSEALNDKNLICKALELIKNNNQIGIMCDVALDPYTNHGHDGIIKNNYVLNDETNQILSKQALLYAKHGCDIVAPSDMMDGRIGLIRKKLDKNNLKNTKILSYAIKYASNFYGPFRDAVGSKKLLKGNKKTYQMDFRNSEESLREVALDIEEGADFVMVKPGIFYLDIVKKINDSFKVPVFSYQVSGEYSLLRYGIQKKILKEQSIYESLVAFKRAGSRAIVTYFAEEIAKELKKN